MYNKQYKNKFNNQNDNKSNNFKGKIVKGGEKLKYILKNTAIEVALLAALGMGIGAYNGTRSELKRTEKIPLAFSEIGAVERQAKKDGITVGEISEYEMKVNDMCMKIFEAYNESQYPFLPNQKDQLFASNIYNAIDLNNIYKYNLKDLLIQIPDYIPQINKKLIKYKMISENLDVSNVNMDKSWYDSHRDNYHTEMRTRTVSDSKGNTHIEVYTVQVYDNTTHDYVYNRKEGNAGARNLNKLFTEIPTIKLDEHILKTTVTNADGEYAAEKSRENTSSKERLTQEQLLAIANTWYTGSTILKNINTVESLYPLLSKSTIERDMAKNSSHDETYKTTSHYDDGPKEFQVAEKTLSLGKQINDNLKEMQQVIETTGIKVPLLEKKINEFIEVGYIKIASSEKESSKLADEIMDLTKEIYKINFKEGINVDRFRLAMVFLYALIGMVLGGATGLGLDALDNKINIYDKIKFKKQ